MKFYIYTISELLGHEAIVKEYWMQFEKYSGVYCFFDSDGEGVKYIGSSMNGTGSRLAKWIFPKENKTDFQANLKSDDFILIVAMAEEHSYMAPALESFLIKKLSPTFNKKK